MKSVDINAMPRKLTQGEYWLSSRAKLLPNRLVFVPARATEWALEMRAKPDLNLLPVRAWRAARHILQAPLALVTSRMTYGLASDRV